jgi:hypothetical protein
MFVLEGRIISCQRSAKIQKKFIFSNDSTAAATRFLVGFSAAVALEKGGAKNGKGHLDN